MASTYNIALNFFPLVERNFSFHIYRREYKTGELSSEFPEYRRRKLPKASLLDMEDIPEYGEYGEYGEYWVSFTKQDEFSLYECDSDMNNLVTVDYLYYLLKEKCSSLSASDEYKMDDDHFYKRIFFVLKKHEEGTEMVWLEPYFLKSKREFGFLADFKFDVRGCDLCLMIASDGNAEDEIIRNFKMEFESKKKECAVLIVRATSNSEKLTIAGFDDAGEFRTIMIDDPSHKLSEELKKNFINKSTIIELATSSLGRTHVRKSNWNIKKILELSLAHKNGEPNRDFYADRFNKFQEFVSKYFNRIFPLKFEVSEIRVSSLLRNIESFTLKPRIYIFNDNRTSKSQFLGVKENGPLHHARPNTKIYFVYRLYDKPLSYDLYKALRGDTFKTFPGMEKMFDFKMDKNHIGGVPTKNFEVSSLEEVCQIIREDAQRNNKEIIIPLVVAPFTKINNGEASQIYYAAKHTFLKYGWPSQFVGADTLKNRATLKWSVSNIGLQLFAKMGGQPWKVRPENEKCLIIGLGQAHQVINGHIKKYFAYSILTDSSGLYKELRILGSSLDQTDYFRTFKQKLGEVFGEFANQYNRFVIHLPFSIRRSEIEAIKEVLNNTKQDIDKVFAVIKFNDENKFFGFSRVSNSLVPYESSYLSLSNDEYLIWFEGLQYQNPNIFKRIERPVHAKFIYPKEIEKGEKIEYLQDALNLSGCNWRGFNGKSLPVSIHYANLIAKYFKEFQSLGLEEINLSTFHPWFL